jgi:hypothetical protein
MPLILKGGKELLTLEMFHQRWNGVRHSKGETAHADVDLPVFAGPRVNPSKPESMHVTEIQSCPTFSLAFESNRQ